MCSTNTTAADNELIAMGRELEAPNGYKRSCARSDPLEARAFATPATTPAGWAVKLNEVEEAILRTGIENPEALAWIASLRLDLDGAGARPPEFLGAAQVAAAWTAVRALGSAAEGDLPVT